MWGAGEREVTPERGSSGPISLKSRSKSQWHLSFNLFNNLSRLIKGLVMSDESYDKGIWKIKNLNEI